MSAYRAPGRLTPAAQRLDLLQAWADHRRLETGAQAPGLGDCGWHWFDLKRPEAVDVGAASRRSRRRGASRGRVVTSPWHA